MGQPHIVMGMLGLNLLALREPQGVRCAGSDVVHGVVNLFRDSMYKCGR